MAHNALDGLMDTFHVAGCERLVGSRLARGTYEDNRKNGHSPRLLSNKGECPLLAERRLS